MVRGRVVDAINQHPVLARPAVSELAVVVAHFNPCDYRRPVENLLETLDHLEALGASVYLAYARFPGLPSSQALFADTGIPPRVRVVKTDTVWFHKEPLWDQAVMHLVPSTVKKILLLDADVRFSSGGALEQIARRLDISRAVHPYSFITYLDASGEVMSRRMSVGRAVLEKRPHATDPRRYQSGFAMALQRTFWRDVGFLYLAPVGGGDTLLCAALTGRWTLMRKELLAQSKSNWDRYSDWAQVTESWSGGRLDTVDVEIEHRYHGSPEDRRYDERRDYLEGFDPDTDVASDDHGLAGWSSSALVSKPRMVAQVREYFWLRCEDE